MKKTLLFAAVLALLASCASTKQVAYFQDAEDVSPSVAAKKEIRIQPKDEISIIANCPSSQVSSLFNLPTVTKRLSLDTEDSYTSGNSVSGYTVDGFGYIDFPGLGKIQVAGKTRDEIASYIKNELIAQEQASEIVVTVDFLNLGYRVLGEVNNPGRFAIERDGVTILDAIAAAGDLTITGKRQNVKVLRIENGAQKTYTVDLCSAESILGSPAYYLQQEDVVYVEPNNMRKRQASINGNNLLSASFWTSLASLAASTALLFVTLM
ncbi:MAG: polysaccharide biosynthesis/export family protein [Bacteroidales bacterium]|nr:polysaccharide biosynthesis/export family protein [Bacteroidales bacterium]